MSYISIKCVPGFEHDMYEGKESHDRNKRKGPCILVDVSITKKRIKQGHKRYIANIRYRRTYIIK